MSLTGVTVEDIVECEIRGDHFYGIVIEKMKGEVMVRPIGVRERYPRLVRAAQVKTRYRRCKS